MIRVGVVGLGNMGKNHLRVYHELIKEGMELEIAGIADIDPQKVGKYVEKYRVKGYTDYRKLIEQGIDAVSIAVPTTLHKQVASDFIKAGVHILIEKPIASTYQDAIEIVREAKRHGVVLLVGHIERFNSAVQKLKELISRGLLGKVLVTSARRVGPTPPRIKDTGVAMDLAIHDLDVFQYITGEKIQNIVIKSGSVAEPLYEDYILAVVELTNGILGSVEANWLTPYKLRKLYVTGDKAVAELDYISQTLVIHNKEFSINVRINKYEPLKNEIKHFINLINGTEKPLISGEEAAVLVKMIQEMLK